MSQIPLPIDEHVPDILNRLKGSSGLVLTAEPGAGKTTRLPPALYQAFSGKILVLEPRRMAAAAAAARVAQEQGWPLGEEVGYQVRFENRTGPKTRLTFLTEALLARRLLSDPELKDVAVVVLDEFHERSIHVDLALGLLRELQLLGHPVKIVVMSATMKAAPIAEFLGNVPCVQVPGQLFPMTIEYQSAPLRLRLDNEFYRLLQTGVKRALQESPQDVLVFLPGAGEIRRAAQELESLRTIAPVEILHGTLSLAEQQAVLRPRSQRRIILSTNIAESSLTIDGVAAVVDSGLARVLRQDPRSGFSRLEVCRIAKANADQRAGRAARQRPGFCFRMWSKTEMAGFQAQEVPEILRTDLSETLLYLALQGVTNFEDFLWFEKPLSSQILRAKAELLQLEALDSQGKITPLGRSLAQWSLPPRLGRLMQESVALSSPALGADLCAILSERDFVDGKTIAEHVADRWECDLSMRADLVNQFRAGEKMSRGEVHSLRSIVRLSNQLRERAGVSKEVPADLTCLRLLMLRAYGDRLARRRGTTDRGIMRGGRGLRLSQESLVKESPFFIAVHGLDLEGAADSLIHQAVGLQKNDLLEAFANKITNHHVCHYDRDQKKFIEVRERRLDDLVIEQSQPQAAPPERVREALGEILLEQLEWLKEQNSQLKRWLERWTFFQKNSDGVPELTADFLRMTLQSAAGTFVDLEKIAQLDLAAALSSHLDYQTREKFTLLAPERLQVPSGSWINVEYPAEQTPFLAVRLQELFGLSESPTVLGGRVPVVLHLLAPNFRPVQTTSDLSSFWRGSYFEVRKELRARYPKHSWPDDPLTALPQAKGRRRT